MEAKKNTKKIGGKNNKGNEGIDEGRLKLKGMFLIELIIFFTILHIEGRGESVCSTSEYK